MSVDDLAIVGGSIGCRVAAEAAARDRLASAGIEADYIGTANDRGADTLDEHVAQGLAVAAGVVLRQKSQPVARADVETRPAAAAR